MTETFGVRAMRPSETPFVVANWDRSMLRRASARGPDDGGYKGIRVYPKPGHRDQSKLARFGSNAWASIDVWRAAYRLSIEALVESEETHIVVAFVDGAPDEPIGFVCYEPGRAHFVFVLAVARNRGVGSMLATVAGLPKAKVTHLTPDGERLLDGLRRSGERQGQALVATEGR